MGILHSHALLLRQKYSGNTEGLVSHLARVCLTQPGLAEEVFSGLDKRIVAGVRQSFYSNLPPGVKIYAGYNNSMMLWPPKTHDDIINVAFDVLDKTYQEAIRTGSRRTDHESLTVPTLLEENAPQHAMTPAKKVKELKSVEKAQEWARGEAKRFVQGKMNQAQTDYQKAIEGPKQGLVYWSTRAYEFFGEAMHTVMDNWSPAHRDFQVYDGSELTKGAAKGALIGSIAGPLGTIVGAGIGAYSTTTEHSKIESRKPTDDEMNAMVDEMRLAFQITFNGTAIAVSTSEMNRTDARLSKRGDKGMLIK